MSKEAAAGSNAGAGDDTAGQPAFQIEKLYVKDLSLEEISR